jgi:hypothetical protein
MWKKSHHHRKEKQSKKTIKEYDEEVPESDFSDLS